MFFESIVLNAGTYEVQDWQVIITAEIAKVPGLLGGKQAFDDQVDYRKLNSLVSFRKISVFSLIKDSQSAL